jgi:tetraacyldisaccharide 4'-kinase
LLDDGFQHRQLARRFDMVVMHQSDLEQRLFPAGRLREPLSSLRRADAIVLRQEDAELEPVLRRHAKPECRFWRIRRRLVLGGAIERAVAFCAIARPEEFFVSLTAHGVGTGERIRFRDHHQYSAADIDRLAAAGKRVGCDAFVITAKDDVKLDDAMRARLNEIAPLKIAALTVEFEDEPAVLAELLSLVKTRGA